MESIASTFKVSTLLEILAVLLNGAEAGPAEEVSTLLEILEVHQRPLPKGEARMYGFNPS